MSSVEAFCLLDASSLTFCVLMNFSSGLILKLLDCPLYISRGHTLLFPNNIVFLP